MSDQKPYPEHLLPDVTSRNLPATQRYNQRGLEYREMELASDRGSEDVNLRALWRMTWSRRWLVIGIVFIVTTLVAIDVFRTKPLYQATGMIEIGRDTGTRVISNEVFIREDEDLLVTMNTSEIILKSAPLLEDVVVQLRLDQTPAFFDVTQKKSFWEALHDIAGIIQQKDAVGPEPAVFTATPVALKFEGRRSPEEVERLAPLADMLAGSLVVRPIRDTRAMTIAFTHTNPGVAASVANAIAARFVETSFDKKIEGFAIASEWLDQSTRELKAKIERSEQALADYTRTNNIYLTEGRETLITERLSRMHDQATRAETERILKESLYDQVRQGRIAQIPEAFADPRTAELQRKLGELAITRAELSVTYGPKYPKMAEIQQQMEVILDQIAATRDLLDEKLRADYERAVRNEQSLNAALAAAKSRATKENQSAIQYSLLKQDVDTSISLYREFLQKTNQAHLEAAQQHSNIRVIAQARVPKSPISPNRERSILMALFLSLAGAIGLVWFLERFDDSIRNVDDVNRFTQVPALGVISTIGVGRSLWNGRKRKEIPLQILGLGSSGKPSKMQRARLMEFDSRSSVAEAYRGLRTALLLSAKGKPPKTILVTSAHPGEGKTTTAANTAISLAQLGGSVLLMDGDLRKPSIQDVFGISHDPGLAMYLTGSADVDEVTHLTQVENLRLIPAGANPPNPSELLSSEGMKRLLDQLAQRYDHIVIDSPPLGSVTDPMILSTMVDGVILVVHGGKNSRQSVQRACHELSAVGARIFGIVLNNVNLRREGDNVYYYTSLTHTKHRH